MPRSSGNRYGASLENPARRAFLERLGRQGIRDDAVLEAMEQVPRERFVGMDLSGFAYDDSPLPIEEGQTISQPFVVARMIEVLDLQPGHRVLEVGAGSGYAAAVMSRLVSEVYTVERHPSLAHQAASRLEELGYHNVHVLCGDGSLGWPEFAPYDAITVAASGPRPPRALIEQMRPGGRLVVPTGSENDQQLQCVTRLRDGRLEVENLGAVRFVQLIGEQGWHGEGEFSEGPADSPGSAGSRPRGRAKGWLGTREKASEKIEAAAQPFDSIQTADLAALTERLGDARVVLLGEASHGTAEFYQMRSRITRELIEKKGFDFVAVEADWPDAAQIDHLVRPGEGSVPNRRAFSRFPSWMWANTQVVEFAKWLRDFNRDVNRGPKSGAGIAGAGFYGLDLYSLYSSIDAVITYLEGVDSETAKKARQRYGCLSAWQKEPARYGAAMLGDVHRSCEKDVLAMLNQLLRDRLELVGTRGERRYFDALANARLVHSAERYYRSMYSASATSWNLRDQHMFETLEHLLGFHGPGAKAIVWAHNSHVGDAGATEMASRGETNMGQLCRRRYGSEARLVGFGTHSGTVAAASDWGEPVEIKTVRPSHPDSYERLCHNVSYDSFILPLRLEGGGTATEELVREIVRPRLERAIGVIYRPETEIQSHYFQASLPQQFDEYLWFDRSRAITPLGPEGESASDAETFPFGL